MFFNAFVDGAYWLAIALIGASVGLMLVVLLLHRRNARYRRTVDSLLSIWKNALEQTLRGEACDVPVREKRTAVDMLRTWCDVSETSGLLPEAWFAAAFPSACGIVKQNVDPTPGFDSTHIFPALASTIF